MATDLIDTLQTLTLTDYQNIVLCLLGHLMDQFRKLGTFLSSYFLKQILNLNMYTHRHTHTHIDICTNMSSVLLL